MNIQTPNAESIFGAAIEIETSADRAEYLEDACKNDPQLRQAIEKLVNDHFAAGDFLIRPVEGFTIAADIGAAEICGSQIGPYKLLEVIGEGGMGTVYMAQQTEPVSRRVALKLIKSGMDTRQVIARFEAERQALALMDHPNIAKVLDAGATDSGRPYFVMELVKGLPITQFCDQRQMNTESRLKLFQKVCQAVQHAHQKGIIHRDLKPSNVLVAMYDDQPVPKVIDFGVSKAVADKLTEETIFTRFGQIVGTLEYMSPEQAQFNNLDIDTRSDIYSLGAILYELLVGEPPYERERLKSQALDETLKMIREEEPTRPSTRLSSIGKSPQAASDRQSSLTKLGSMLKGDLDWIVLKALAKDRTLRYETANAFADDIERYLQLDPVLATPPSSLYRIRKFVRRRATETVIGVAIAAILVAGLIGLKVANFKLSERENETLAALDLAQENMELAVEASKKEKAARSQAEKEQTISESVLEFVVRDILAMTTVEGQFGYSEVGVKELGRDATLADLLERATAGLNSNANLVPQVEAELRKIVGVSFRNLGRFDESIGHLDRVIELRRQTAGEPSVELADALNSVAVTYAACGRHEQALEYVEQAYETVKLSAGPDDESTLVILTNLAHYQLKAGDVRHANRTAEEAYNRAKEALGPANKYTLHAISIFAGTLVQLGKFEEAGQLWMETLDTSDASLPLTPQDLSFVSNIAGYFETKGQLTDAREALKSAIERANQLFETANETTLILMQKLGRIEGKLGNNKVSQEILEQVTNKFKDNFGNDGGRTLACQCDLATAMAATGEFDKAFEILEKVYDVWHEKLGADHPKTLFVMQMIAQLDWQVKDFNSAISLYKDLAAKSKQIFGEDSHYTQKILANLGSNYKHAHRFDEAEPLLEHAAELANQDSSFYWCRDMLIDLYLKTDRVEQADEVADVELEDIESLLPMLTTRTAHRMRYLTRFYLLPQKKFEDAERMTKQALAHFEQVMPNHWQTFSTQSMLGESLVGQRKLDKAELHLIAGAQGLIESQKTIPPVSRIELTSALQRLIDYYEMRIEADSSPTYRDRASRWRSVLQSLTDSNGQK